MSGLVVCAARVFEDAVRAALGMNGPVVCEARVFEGTRLVQHQVWLAAPLAWWILACLG